MTLSAANEPERRATGRVGATRRRTAFELAIGLSAILVIGSLLACGKEEPPAPPTPDATTTRTLGDAEVVGLRTEAGAQSWRGLPFAAPPVGPLRWRASEPPSPLAGRIEAVEFAEPCVQFAPPSIGPADAEPGDLIGSEDCLALNIFAPGSAAPGDAARPVLFWIHGGGNSVGDPFIYDGSHLAEKQDLVVVTVAYRLGAFGWANHPALFSDADDAETRSGNFGTLDLIRALEWVGDHIAAFGGDPERITIFGESAGGSNVFSLLAAPAARGLFHGAIAQSGSAGFRPLAQAQQFRDTLPPGTPKTTADMLQDILIESGEAEDAATARRLLAERDPALPERLRGVSVETVFAGISGDRAGGMYGGPWLIGDGHVLPAMDGETAFSTPGLPSNVPVIAGTNRDENRLFMAMDPNSRYIRRLGGVPLWFRNETDFVRDAEYQSLLWKLRGVDLPARGMSSFERAPVYGYRFDWDEEGKLFFADLSRMLGAAHAIEIPFVFGLMDFGRMDEMIFDPDRKSHAIELSNAMMSYWAEFARTGDPGRGTDGSLPLWPSWNGGESGAEQFLLFDTEADGGIRLSDETVTLDSILAQLVADPRFESWEERCETLGLMIRFARDLPREVYGQIGDGACQAWPLELES